jgi:hypothetical protein
LSGTAGIGATGVDPVVVVEPLDAKLRARTTTPRFLGNATLLTVLLLIANE